MQHIAPRRLLYFFLTLAVQAWESGSTMRKAAPDFLINDFDSYIDILPLENCHLEICAGIAKSKANMSSRVIPHFEMQKDFDGLFDFKSNEGARIGNVATEGAEFLATDQEKEYFFSLSHEQKKRFLQLYKNAYWDGEFVRIKFTRKEFLQNSYATFYDSMSEWHQNAEHFPKTREFIKTLPFKEVGRILFFVSYHYLHSDVHYDRKDDCFNGKHHFIWLNPFKQKNFFLIDDQKKQHDINSKTAFFNTRYLHGAAPTDKMTYTLRVDGQLDEDFCKKTGILWAQR